MSRIKLYQAFLVLSPLDENKKMSKSLSLGEFVSRKKSYFFPSRLDIYVKLGITLT
jgi:hypothetical protein